MVLIPEDKDLLEIIVVYHLVVIITNIVTMVKV